MRLVLSQRHKDYEIRLLQPPRAMRLASPMLEGKRRRGLDNTRTVARHLKKVDA
jgi:hypothetical protein